MKILVFSDLHGDAAALRKLMRVEADHYIAAGDLVTWGKGLDSMGLAMQAKREKVHVLPGNHEDEAQIETFCDKFGFHSLHGKTFQQDGWTVAGLGYSNPTPFNTPGEYSEKELTQRLEPFAGLWPLILVCHCPPLKTDLDRAGMGRHFGSAAVRDFVEAQQPAWFLCGHIHEAEGREVTLGMTRAVNVGKTGFLVET